MYSIGMFLGVSIHQKKWQISKENKTFFKVSVLFPPTQRHSTKRSYGIWKYKCLWTESTCYKNPSNIPNWRYGFVVCQKLQSNHSHFKLNKEYADYLLIYRHRIARFVYVVKVDFRRIELLYSRFLEGTGLESGLKDVCLNFYCYKYYRSSLELYYKNRGKPLFLHFHIGLKIMRGNNYTCAEGMKS